jgi:hypothetical protein
MIRWLMQDKMNQHIKSIVNVPYTVSTGPNPHCFMYSKGKGAVNELKLPISSVDEQCAFSHPVTTTRIAVHHYVLKSEEDYRCGSGYFASTGLMYWCTIQSTAVKYCPDVLVYHRKYCPLS